MKEFKERKLADFTKEFQERTLWTVSGSFGETLTFSQIKEFFPPQLTKQPKKPSSLRLRGWRLMKQDGGKCTMNG